ncbi:PDZ domain-containing protein, partial [Mesorhizobium argentiipisi]
MGALVAQVQSGSPASEAGLQPGDVIIAFNGQPIESSAELPKVVGVLPAGSEAEMIVVRNGEQKTLSVTLGELPDNPQQAMLGAGGDNSTVQGDTLGLTVRDASKAELARADADQGVIVTRVEEGPAATAGLQ